MSSKKSEVDLSVLKAELEEAYERYEALQTIYERETDRRWVMPLYIEARPCIFCGEYRHTDDCRMR